MVGPAVLTFVKELGEHFGSSHPQVFGFIDSLEATPLSSPGLEFLEGTYFWEAYPRYAGANQTEFDKFYREKVGVDANGASISDPNDISTYSHMFGCWETLYVIKQAMEAAGYKSATDADKKALIEATEAITSFAGVQRASAGRQDLQRKNPPVFWAPEHLEGGRRQAQRRAPHVDRGRALRAGGGLHDDGALIGAMHSAAVAPVCRMSGDGDPKRPE